MCSSDLIDDPNLDKKLIAAIFKGAGEQGELILTKLLKSNPNPRIRIAAASVLAFRKKCTKQ